MSITYLLIRYSKIVLVVLCDDVLRRVLRPQDNQEKMCPLSLMISVTQNGAGSVKTFQLYVNLWVAALWQTCSVSSSSSSHCLSSGKSPDLCAFVAKVLRSAWNPMPCINQAGQLLCLRRRNLITSSPKTSPLISLRPVNFCLVAACYTQCVTHFIHALVHLAFYSTNITSINVVHVGTVCMIVNNIERLL